MPLLRSLTNEELDQYGRVALDQMQREDRWKILQGFFVLVAALVALWSVGRMYSAGFSASTLYTLGISALMGYWPYRSAKSKRLWRGHLDAVRGEKARRAEVVG